MNLIVYCWRHSRPECFEMTRLISENINFPFVYSRLFSKSVESLPNLTVFTQPLKRRKRHIACRSHSIVNVSEINWLFITHYRLNWLELPLYEYSAWYGLTSDMSHALNDPELLMGHCLHSSSKKETKIYELCFINILASSPS